MSTRYNICECSCLVMFCVTGAETRIHITLLLLQGFFQAPIWASLCSFLNLDLLFVFWLSSRSCSWNMFHISGLFLHQRLGQTGKQISALVVLSSALVSPWIWAQQLHALRLLSAHSELGCTSSHLLLSWYYSHYYYYCFLRLVLLLHDHLFGDTRSWGLFFKFFLNILKSKTTFSLLCWMLSWCEWNVQISPVSMSNSSKNTFLFFFFFAFYFYNFYYYHFYYYYWW